jgi:hydroxyquinol 1,2-dioxygenase
MRDLDQSSITDAVVARFSDTPDPRLRRIVTSLVRHLHDFVKDVELTQDEWKRGVEFLTRTGHLCDDKRQEFILLSDVLGISMLVDAINHPVGEAATQTTVLGPFYVAGVPESESGCDVARGAAGEPLYIEGKVSSAKGGAIPGALVDLWQADPDGYYDVQRGKDLCLRTRLRSDARGHFHLWSVVPSPYPIPNDGPVGELLEATARHPNRPAHVHFMIAAPGHETLVTHVFAADSPWLDSDAVFGVKDSLVVEFARAPPGIAPDGRRMESAYRRLCYDFVLSPSRPERISGSPGEP